MVCWFWEVAHSLDEARKKRLLFFVTGSDRVPIKGLGHLNPPFVISRWGCHTVDSSALGARTSSIHPPSPSVNVESGNGSRNAVLYVWV